ncbi:MAG TPA: DUF6268 family outer membrane beta-barrel protein [Longimicrobiales bacterium]|nr:DUF6268 family outer membrane beta-barrel protein [Longimicrobiales bacterium]
MSRSPVVIAGVVGLVGALVGTAEGQGPSGPTFSMSVGAIPFSDASRPSPAPGMPFDSRLRARSLSVGVSIPQSLGEGRTSLTHEVAYHGIDFDFRAVSAAVPGSPLADRVHSVRYGLTVSHGLSPRWMLLGVVAPGLASDFHGDVGDDLTLQAVAGLIRAFSPRVSAGFGLAYSTQFGTPAPLPALSFDWNNGENLRAHVLAPVVMELWYAPHPRVELGVGLQGQGDRYGLDGDAEGGSVDLDYTEIGAGPTVLWRATPRVRVRVQSAFTLYREYDIRGDGLGSLDLDRTRSLVVGLELGG